MATSYYTTFHFSKTTPLPQTVLRNDNHNHTSTFNGDAIEHYYASLTEIQKEGLEVISISSPKVLSIWERKNNLFSEKSLQGYFEKSSQKPLKRQQNGIANINSQREYVAEQISLDTCYIWQAEKDKVIGSKVGHSRKFRQIVKDLIENHDTSKDRAKGQHFLMMTEDQIQDSVITCGVGLNTTDPNDYIHRLYRGRVQSFLTRRHALQVNWCAVIVYDREAYLADPQLPTEERERVLSGSASHFLVALLANAKDVPDAYGTYRFVSNLCGGNNAFKDLTLEEIKEMAQKSLDYQDKWCVVAD